MDEKISIWAQNITFVGNEYTNKSDRRGMTPSVIVDHISEGTAQSCIDWFTSSKNTVSSAHFLVARDGRVFQFVEIEKMAWGNGLSAEDIKASNNSIIRSKGVNPNWYTVSIEHEGVYVNTKGALTENQLISTIMLHEYIIQYIKDKYATDIPRSRESIWGHFEVDPKRKPNCPGEKFPFVDIIEGLNVMKPIYSDIQGHWAEHVITEAARLGLVHGFPDKSFRPDQPISRAEMAQIAINLYNSIMDRKV